jgi:hypothetical protein
MISWVGCGEGWSVCFSGYSVAAVVCVTFRTFRRDGGTAEKQ